MKKKLFAILLSLTMVVTMMPVMTFTAYAGAGDVVFVDCVNGDDGGEGTESSPYKTVGKAIDAATDGSTVKLLSDVDGAITYNSSKNLTLDLAGKVITNTGSNSPIITIQSGKSLTLKDSKQTESHYFKYKKKGMWTWVQSPTQNEKEQAISIENITEETPDDSIILVLGGIITGGNGADAGGVLIEGGQLTLDGGNIVGNKSSNTKSGGGVGVFGSSFNMNGGAIIGNTPQTIGGGVHLWNHQTYGASTFNFNGGSISHNYASQAGAGIYNGGQTVNMTGGIISANYAGEKAAGVFSDGTFKMSGGSIIKNVVTNNYSYWFGGVQNSGTMIVGGTANISLNKYANYIYNLTCTNKIAIGTGTGDGGERCSCTD